MLILIYTAAERVLTKSHQLGKVQLHLRQVSEIPETEEQAITIQLKNIPPDVDKLYIELCVNNIPQVSVGDIKNGSCSINLPALHSQGDISICMLLAVSQPWLHYTSLC